MRADSPTTGTLLLTSRLNRTLGRIETAQFVVLCISPGSGHGIAARCTSIADAQSILREVLSSLSSFPGPIMHTFCEIRKQFPYLKLSRIRHHLIIDRYRSRLAN